MRDLRNCIRPAMIGAAGLAGLIALSGIALAQLTTDTPTQSELLKLPNATQGDQLAGVIRRAMKDRKCSSARVSLEKTFSDGVGGWLVQCEEGQDYWVNLPVQTKKAAITLPCIIARVTTRTDCYANFRTVLPEHVEQCEKSPHPDRMIGACTAIIQSGRLDGHRDALSTVYQARATAFSRYQQSDLALADFDRAVTLSPASADALYNRAVALERKGDYDQAIRDLDEVLRLKPDYPHAHYERGFVHLNRNDYGHAIDDFGQAIRLTSDDAKAWRGRSQAYRAKGESAKADADQQRAMELDPVHGREPLQPARPAPASPPQIAAKQVQGALTEPDSQAAYCLQASVGFTSQYTRLTSLLRDNVKNGEAMRAQPGLSPADKEKVAAGLKSLGEAISVNEASSKRWNANTGVFIGYLTRRGLLGGEKIIAPAEDARRDQQAVAETYSACLRLCKPDNPSCKNVCNDKATASDASTRLLGCEQIATNLK